MDDSDYSEWKQTELSQCLAEASALTGIDSDACTLLRRKLLDKTFNLVVAGEFKRGKSSIINALLGEEILPVGVVPLTSVITVIQAGAVPAARAQMLNGHSDPIALDHLADMNTEPGNPGNVKGVRQIVVDYPSDWLHSGICLVDTPGIGSLHEHNTEVTRAYMPQADAVLFVASVDQPFSQDELRFLDSIRRHAEGIFCLLNKIDHLAPTELAQALAYATSAMRNALGTAIPVYPVSARMAIEARKSRNGALLKRSGFAEFEAALRAFIVEERMDVWLRSVSRSLLGMLGQARHVAELESSALTGPLDQIERKLSAFQERRADVQRSRNDQQVLLEVDARALLRGDVEPALEQFKCGQIELLPVCIEEWYLQRRALSSRQLRAELEAKIIEAVRTAYDGWLVRENFLLAHAFEAMCKRFWSHLQGVISELTRYSSELFALAWTQTDMEGEWQEHSEFHYKFWYEPTSLSILSTSIVLALPKWLAGRLIVRRMKLWAREIAEMQAGRIRHDIEERLKQSVRDAQHKMTQRAEAIIARIEAAIESAIATRQQSQLRIAARQAELAARCKYIAAIEARVRQSMP